MEAAGEHESEVHLGAVGARLKQLGNRWWFFVLLGEVGGSTGSGSTRVWLTLSMVAGPLVFVTLRSILADPPNEATDQVRVLRLAASAALAAIYIGAIGPIHGLAAAFESDLVGAGMWAYCRTMALWASGDGLVELLPRWRRATVWCGWSAAITVVVSAALGIGWMVAGAHPSRWLVGAAIIPALVSGIGAILTTASAHHRTTVAAVAAAERPDNAV